MSEPTKMLRIDDCSPAALEALEALNSTVSTDAEGKYVLKFLNITLYKSGCPILPESDD